MSTAHAAPRSRRRRAGFTLLEVVISGGILAVLLGLAAGGTLRATEAHRGTFERIDLERRARAALDRVLDRLTDCELSTIAEDLTAPSGSSSVSLRPTIGWDGSSVVLGTQIAFSMAADPADPVNGADDDGDGVVDQRRLQVQVGTASPVVFSRNVLPLLDGETSDGTDENGNGLEDEPGFCVSRDGGAVTVRLSLRRRGPDGVLRTVTVWGVRRIGT